MAIQLTDATLMANNEAVGIVPNSLNYTEGFGEQTVKTVSIGGGKVESLYSNNVETSLSKLNFELPGTVDNIELVRDWKSNLNRNVFQIAGDTADGKQLTRTFTQAAVTNDYTVEIGADGVVSVEIMSNSSI